MLLGNRLPGAVGVEGHGIRAYDFFDGQRTADIGNVIVFGNVSSAPDDSGVAGRNDAFRSRNVGRGGGQRDSVERVPADRAGKRRSGYGIVNRSALQNGLRRRRDGRRTFGNGKVRCGFPGCVVAGSVNPRPHDVLSRAERRRAGIRLIFGAFGLVANEHGSVSRVAVDNRRVGGVAVSPAVKRHGRLDSGGRDVPCLFDGSGIVARARYGYRIASDIRGGIARQVIISPGGKALLAVFHRNRICLWAAAVDRRNDFRRHHGVRQRLRRDGHRKTLFGCVRRAVFPGHFVVNRIFSRVGSCGNRGGVRAAVAKFIR